MGKPLTRHDEVLFRQIHPSYMRDGKPASDRFKPQPSDAGMMSVDRGALTTASTSHALYISTGRKSAAVYGLAVGEFVDETVKCQESPLETTEDGPANPAHALADYTPHPEKNWKNISKRLWRKAVARGQLHP